MQDPIFRVEYADGSWQEIDLTQVLRVFYVASEKQHVVHQGMIMLRLDTEAQADLVLAAWRNYKNQLQSILTPYEAVMN